jgi:hypothetical protein
MQAICQRCGERKSAWTVKQADFNVRELQFWTVQLCELCAVQVEMLVRAALASPLPMDAVDPAGTGGEKGPTRDA